MAQTMLDRPIIPQHGFNLSRRAHRSWCLVLRWPTRVARNRPMPSASAVRPLGCPTSQPRGTGSIRRKRPHGCTLAPTHPPHSSPRPQPLLLPSPMVTAAAGEANSASIAAPPNSSETNRSLRAAREQAARQGLMFAGPDQLLLGVLATAPAAAASRGGNLVGVGGGGGGESNAAAALEAALGGGDVDSVREWLNEQTGVVAPLVYGGAGGSGGAGGGGVSSSWLRPSDVEFTAAAREALRLAMEAAEAMGSRSVGTYHLLLVLLQGAGAGRAGGAGAGAGTRAGGTATEGVEAGASGEGDAISEAAAPATSSPGGQTGDQTGAGAGNRQSAPDSVRPSSSNAATISRSSAPFSLLPALLRAAGADTDALRRQLLAMAERDEESPPALAPQAAYEDVVAQLRSAYQQQQQSGRPLTGLPGDDDQAFRSALPRRPPGDTATQVAADDDIYE